MKYSLLLLALLSTSAMAAKPDFENGHDNRDNGNQGQAQGQAQGQGQGQLQGQVQGQLQGQAQGQIAKGGSAKQGQQQSTANANNSAQSVTVNGDNYDYERSLPQAYAPSMSPSANCMGVVSGGATGLTFGASFGKSYLDEGCQLRETSRTLMALGEKAAAVKVMCANADAAKALGEAICPVAKPATTANAAAYSVNVNPNSTEK